MAKGRAPRITAREAVRAFQKAGFELVRTSGSHHILKRDGHRYLVNVPLHKGRTLGTGLLDKLIEDAGLTVEEFRAYLNS